MKKLFVFMFLLSSVSFVGCAQKTEAPVEEPAAEAPAETAAPAEEAAPAEQAAPAEEAPAEAAPAEAAPAEGAH